MSSSLIILGSVYSILLLFFFIGLFFPKKGKNKKRYFVSVVVAARNEEDSIAGLLLDLVNQTYPEENYEVIIVDDDSIDNTASIVSDFAKDHDNIRLLRSLPLNKSLTPKKRALDLGIRESRGEVILTTDADCRVKPTWIEAMVSYFADEVGMVVGFSQLGYRGEKGSLLEKLQALDFLSLMAAAAGTTNLGFPLAASGQNLAYRKEVFHQVGGFTRIGHRVSGDDVLFLQLVKGQTPWRIVFASSEKAFNTSAPEKTLRDLFNQRKRWASNSSYQIYLNKFFFLILLVVFLFNLSLMVAPLYCIITGRAISSLLVALGLKMFSEFIVILKGGAFFHRLDLVKYFPLWFLLQIPYVVFAGLWGTFGGFTWKERRH